MSDPCDQNALLPIVFYNWQRQLFENAASAPRPPEPAAPSRALEATVEALEKQVAKKDAVIAWVTEEHVKLRKRTWGALTAVRRGVDRHSPRGSTTLRGCDLLLGRGVHHARAASH